MIRGMATVSTVLSMTAMVTASSTKPSANHFRVLSAPTLRPSRWLPPVTWVGS